MDRFSNDSRIKLLNEDGLNYFDDNHFTILIGNNGTGKSRILSGIVNYFIKRKPRNYRLDVKYNGMPDKVIAMTSAMSDKFPVDNNIRHRAGLNTLNLRDELYNYLGNRNRTFSFSSKSSINRALDIIFQTYTDIHSIGSFVHIFDYLEYEPLLRVHCRIKLNKINQLLTDKQNSLFSEQIFLDFLDDKSKNTDFNKKYYHDLIDDYEGDSSDIIQFLNDLILTEQKNIAIDIPFGERVKQKIMFSNDSDYAEKNLESYRILTILQKIGLVSGYDIRVFKKGGQEFRFDEASSGEANILSSMLALTALLKNNTLVLIDEPEISLHPIWQSKYMDLLRKSLTDVRGCHIIIATHSHFILSDTPEEDSSVIALSRDNYNIKGTIVDQSTYGQSADFLLLNIFGIPSTRNWYLSRIITRGLEILSNKDKDLFELDQIKSQLIPIVPKMKDDDPLKTLALVLLKYKKVDG